MGSKDPAAIRAWNQLGDLLEGLLSGLGGGVHADEPPPEQSQQEWALPPTRTTQAEITDEQVGGSTGPPPRDPIPNEQPDSVPHDQTDPAPHDQTDPIPHEETDPIPHEETDPAPHDQTDPEPHAEADREPDNPPTEPGPPDDLQVRIDAWIDEYLRSCPPGREITSIKLGDVTYIFDSTSRPVRGEPENRVVAVFGRSARPTEARDKDRMQDHPNAYEIDRGHFVAHSMGGGLDINLFPQDPRLNEGHSAEGKEWRAIERDLAKNPGAEFFVRPIYVDNSQYPVRIEYGIKQSSGEWQVKSFDNRP